MLESIAKTKWCPFILGACCKGTDCMMFQVTVEGYDRPADIYHEAESRETEGYCGLARRV